MRPPEMLTTCEATVLRSGRPILDKVSVSFAPGTFTAVLGPNGAGKSTLLRVLSGSLTPDEGTVTLNGRPLSGYQRAELARRRAVLAQESLLQFDFSVEEVVILGRIPHLSGWESERDRRACARAIAVTELRALRHRRYLSLSGGEKQRVQLARVLAQIDPAEAEHPGDRWLLLDEPTAALDLRHQHSMVALVRSLARSHGFGVIVIVHDLNLAMQYADNVVLLDQGRLAASGPTPETLTVARISDVFGVTTEIHCPRSNACPFIQTLPSNHAKNELTESIH